MQSTAQKVLSNDLKELIWTKNYKTLNESFEKQKYEIIWTYFSCKIEIVCFSYVRIDVFTHFSFLYLNICRKMKRMCSKNAKQKNMKN